MNRLYSANPTSQSIEEEKATDSPLERKESRAFKTDKAVNEKTSLKERIAGIQTTQKKSFISIKDD